MNILITGGNGMLAYALKLQLEKLENVHVHSCDKDTCDITDPASLQNIFTEFQPEVVFNCAAYTAVDQAEEDLETAMKVNAEGARNLALLCAEHDAILVHYSTDYVFDGNKENYNEDDVRDPINAYGVSKAKGEEAIEEILGNSQGKYYIVRTAWLYGPNGPNFAETMLRLGKERDSLTVVNDQHGSPTLTIDLAKASTALTGLHKDSTEKFPYGIYHLTNSGNCTWFEYTQKIFEFSDISTPVAPVGSDQFPRPAKRPAYSILNNNKGPHLRNWDTALKDYLENYR